MRRVAAALVALVDARTGRAHRRRAAALPVVRAMARTLHSLGRPIVLVAVVIVVVVIVVVVGRGK